MGKAQQIVEQHPAGTEFRCKRCGAGWRTRKAGVPKSCASCKSFYWDKPVQAVPHASRGVGAEPAG